MHLLGSMVKFEANRINHCLKSFNLNSMSNPSKILLKMNHRLQNFFALFEQAAHPAAGKNGASKSRKKTPYSTNHKATPDCLNLRDLAKKQDGFRRNPAP